MARAIINRVSSWNLEFGVTTLSTFNINHHSQWRCFCDLFFSTVHHHQQQTSIMSDSEDDMIPISQMVAKRKSKRNKQAAATIKPAPKKKAPAKAPSPPRAGSRRSRRLRQGEDEEEEETAVEKEPIEAPPKPKGKKKAPAKKKAKTAAAAKATTDLLSPRKTRSMRKNSKTIAKEEDILEEEASEEDSQKQEVDTGANEQEGATSKDVSKQTELGAAVNEGEHDSPKSEPPKEDKQDASKEVLDKEAAMNVEKDEKSQQQISSAPKLESVDSAVKKVEKKDADSKVEGSPEVVPTKDADAKMKVSSTVMKEAPSKDGDTSANAEVPAKDDIDTDDNVTEQDKGDTLNDKSNDAPSEAPKPSDVDENKAKSVAKGLPGLKGAEKSDAPLESLLDTTNAKESQVESMETDKATSPEEQQSDEKPDVAVLKPTVGEANRESEETLPANDIEKKDASQTKETTVAADKDEEMVDAQGNHDPSRVDDPAKPIAKESSPLKLLAELAGTDADGPMVIDSKGTKENKSQAHLHVDTVMKDIAQDSHLPTAVDVNDAVPSESRETEKASPPESPRQCQAAMKCSPQKEPLSPLDLLATVADNDTTMKDTKEAGPQLDAVATKGGAEVPSQSESTPKVANKEASALAADESKDRDKASPLESQVSRQHGKATAEVMAEKPSPSQTAVEEAHRHADVSMVDVPKEQASYVDCQVPEHGDKITKESSGDASATEVAAKCPDQDAAISTVDSSKESADFAPVIPPAKQETTGAAEKTQATDSDTKILGSTEPMQVAEPAEPQMEPKKQARTSEAMSPSPRAPSTNISVADDGTHVQCESQLANTAVGGIAAAPVTGTTSAPEPPVKQPAVCTGGAPCDFLKNPALSSEQELPPTRATQPVPDTRSPKVFTSERKDVVHVDVTTLARPCDAGTLDPRKEGGERSDMEMKGRGSLRRHEEAPATTAGDTGVEAAPTKTPVSNVVDVKATVVTKEHGTAPSLTSGGVAVDKNPTGDESTVLALPKPSPRTEGANEVAEAIKGETTSHEGVLGEKDKGAAPMEVDAITEKHEAHDVPQSLSPGDNPMEINPALKKKVAKPVEQQVQLRIANKAEMEPRQPEVAKATASNITAVSDAFKPHTVDDTAALLDAFPGMIKRKKDSNFRPKKRRRKLMSIRISSIPPSSGNSEPETMKSAELTVASDPPQGLTDTFMLDSHIFSSDFVSELQSENVSSQYEREFEESLAFFSETHEDQDPVYIELQQEKEKQKLKDEFSNIKKEYEDGVAKINMVIASQMHEKQAHADISVEKARQAHVMEEHRDLQRLQEAYAQKVKSNNSKISHGIKLMTNRQNQDMQKAHLQHRQQAQQRGASEQAASAEWGPIAQRLQAKQQQALKEFNAKGEEVKKRYEVEYHNEKEKYMAHHQKRRKDLEHNLEKVLARMRANFQQQHHRYMKALALRLKKRREEIILLLSESKQEQHLTPHNTESEKEAAETAELRSPSPVELRGISGSETEGDAPGAASRSKHRKTILGTVHKQLSVEIHNEGLWVSALREKADDSKKDAKNDSEFIPWSIKARSVLQSIVCGEIPQGYGANRFDFGDAVAAQGGHIRCVVVDLRTSEETASAQRVVGMRGQEADNLKAIEEKVEKLGLAVVEAEKHNSKTAMEEKEVMMEHEKAVKDLEKAKEVMDHFRKKFKDLLGPGKSPVVVCAKGEACERS